VLADSATGALHATKAVLADSAIGSLRSATSAIADSAIKAGFAVKMTGITVDADSVKFSKKYLKFLDGYTGNIETKYTSGSNKHYSGIYMDPIEPSLLLSVQYSGSNSGGGAGLKITLDSISTSAPINSSAGFHTAGDVVASSIQLYINTAFQTCTDSNMGLIFLFKSGTTYTLRVCTGAGTAATL